jgi:hypothetical protein
VNIRKCHDTVVYCERTLRAANLQATRKTTWRLLACFVAFTRQAGGSTDEHIVVDRQLVVMQAPASWLASTYVLTYIHHITRTRQSHRSRSTTMHAYIIYHICTAKILAPRKRHRDEYHQHISRLLAQARSTLLPTGFTRRAKSNLGEAGFLEEAANGSMAFWTDHLLPGPVRAGGDRGGSRVGRGCAQPPKAHACTYV